MTTIVIEKGPWQGTVRIDTPTVLHTPHPPGHLGRGGAIGLLQLREKRCLRCGEPFIGQASRKRCEACSAATAVERQKRKAAKHYRLKKAGLAKTYKVGRAG